MGRPRRLVILLGAVAAAAAVAAVVRHGRGAARRREEQGSILIGDVASMPFPGGSFDLVVSTMSMHHWADPVAGLTEMARVLRPGARALVWDFRPGFVPFHARIPDPVEHTLSTPLRVVSATPWRWP